MRAKTIKEYSPMLILILAIIILTIICFIASLFVEEVCIWLSNVFMSIACGLITGLVIYVLSNYRNNKQENTREEFRTLSKLRHKASKLSFEIRYNSKSDNMIYEDELETVCLEYINTFSDICEDLLSMPDDLFLELGMDIENSETDYYYVTYDDLYNKYDSAETGEQIENIMGEIDKRLTKIKAQIQGPLEKKRKILKSLNSKSL